MDHSYWYNNSKKTGGKEDMDLEPHIRNVYKIISGNTKIIKYLLKIYKNYLSVESKNFLRQSGDLMTNRKVDILATWRVEPS